MPALPTVDTILSFVIACFTVGALISYGAESLPLFKSLPSQGARVAIFLACLFAPALAFYSIGIEIATRPMIAFLLAAGLVTWVGSQLTHDKNGLRESLYTAAKKRPATWGEFIQTFIASFYAKSVTPDSTPTEGSDEQSLS